MKFNDIFIWMINGNFADKNAKFLLRRNNLFRRSTKSRRVVEIFFFFLHEVVLFPKFPLIFIRQNVNQSLQFFYGFIFTDKYLYNDGCILIAKVKGLKNIRLIETWLIFRNLDFSLTRFINCNSSKASTKKIIDEDSSEFQIYLIKIVISLFPLKLFHITKWNKGKIYVSFYHIYSK